MRHILTRLPEYGPIRPELKDVKNEFRSGNYKTILFHLYSGLYDKAILSNIIRDLKEHFPTAHIAGTLSAGEIMHGRLMETGVLLSTMLFEQTDIYVLKYMDVAGHETEIGKALCKELEQIKDVKALELLCPGTRYNTLMMFEELKNCSPDIQIFGGYAGGHEPDIFDSFVLDSEGIYENALFAIAYAGKEFHIQTDKSAGWQSLGRGFKVTKAENNRLIEIDDAPAVEIYENYLNIDRHSKNFEEETFEFPLVLHTDGEELLRHTIAVENDGSLLLAGYVTEGMDVYLSFGNPSIIVERVNESIETIRLFNPEAVLLYSCSVRKAFWEHFVDIEMIPFETLAATAGFHTWGEIKRNPDTNRILEYNITLLSVAMREGSAGSPKVPEIRIEDSVLKGQASLIKRLSQLVATTTTELQAAYANLKAINNKLVDMNEHDALTGIYNRKKIEDLITTELDNCLNTEIPVSLVMLDIDHFKIVNDTYGHAIGDETLKLVSKLMWESVKNIKYAATGRWGGEEFFILLPHTGKRDAKEFAERLRKKIASSDFPEVHHLTVSMGIITTIGSGSRNDLFTKVDDALYQAKASGRNCVVVCSTDSETVN